MNTVSLDLTAWPRMIWHGTEAATASRQNQRHHFSYLQAPALNEKVFSELAVGVEKELRISTEASVTDQTIV